MLTKKTLLKGLLRRGIRLISPLLNTRTKQVLVSVVTIVAVIIGPSAADYVRFGSEQPMDYFPSGD